VSVPVREDEICLRRKVPEEGAVRNSCGRGDLGRGDPVGGSQFYVPNQVSRDTIWTYDAGKPVYELVSPESDVYVMQSYAQIADHTLTIKQLSDLA
jgi:hypothetical protein